MKFSSIKFSTLVVIGIAITGCATGTHVQRTSAETTIDLSGKWNDADSRMVSQEMIQDMVNQPWYSRYVQKKRGQVPIVRLGEVDNRSSEHIETQTFIGDIQRAMINSGKLRFMSNQSQTLEVRNERASQELNARETQLKMNGNELGSDLMLQGTIVSQNDYDGRQSIRFYQVDLQLTDVESGEAIWTGQKKIKKEISKPRFR